MKNNKIKKEKTTIQEGGASVVGSIKVSDNLFSFDAFKKPKPKLSNQVFKDENKNSHIILPDPKKINPVGSGEKVDVVVIGAGPGGYDIAARLGQDGLKTVVIEDRFAGGVCLNIGCIPTKALLKGAKVHSYMCHSKELGIDLDMEKVKINWSKMQDRKNKISATLEKGVEMRIKAAKAEFIKGYAKIIDKYNIEVAKRKFTTKYIIIASGSRPVSLDKLPGFKEGYKNNKIINSTGALNLKKLPQKIVIVGGGYIGVEFAILFNEFGVKVTILERTNQILGLMDYDVKKWIYQHLKSKGIEIKTNVEVTKFDKNQVIFKDKNGKKGTIAVEKLLVSVGRIPNNMNVDQTLGVKLGAKGEILVNDIMQTNIKNIFAIGDVVGHIMLAHTAYRHAAVLHKAFNGKNSPYNRNVIPSCVYIYPEISAIGKTEEQLKLEGVDYEVSMWNNHAVGRALAESDTSGFTKIIYEKKYGLILGAHIINASSSEIITEIATIMEMEGTIFELSDTTHPHPALSEGIYEAVVVAREKLMKKKFNNDYNQKK